MTARAVLSASAIAAWGNITGTLGNQIDLQAVLDGKAGFFVQEDTPVAGVEGDYWYRPSTKIVKYLESAVWKDFNVDDEYF